MTKKDRDMVYLRRTVRDAMAREMLQRMRRTPYTAAQDIGVAAYSCAINAIADAGVTLTGKAREIALSLVRQAVIEAIEYERSRND
jgi:hypothetical protein